MGTSFLGPLVDSDQIQTGGSDMDSRQEHRNMNEQQVQASSERNTAQHEESTSSHSVTSGPVNGNHDADQTPKDTRKLLTTEDLQNKRAVCFGWIKHPDTTTWRKKVNEFSENSEEYPTWSDTIADRVREYLRQKGISEFFVDADDSPKKGSTKRKSEDNNNHLGIKEQSNPSKSHLSGKWREATDEEFRMRTRQRFFDARKSLSKASSARSQKRRSKGSQPSTSLNRSTAAAERQLIYVPMPERSVCFGWNHHPGTIKWLEMVQQCSDNETIFSEWDDLISELVKRKLEKESYGPFLLAANASQWVNATPKDIVEMTKLQFLRNRGLVKDPPTDQIHGSTGTVVDIVECDTPLDSESSWEVSCVARSTASVNRACKQRRYDDDDGFHFEPPPRPPPGRAMLDINVPEAIPAGDSHIDNSTWD